MKELVFMRHGAALSAQESEARDDSGRKLSRDGKAQAAASSSRLKELGFYPGIIISSPFLRAVETAGIAAALFPGAARAEEPELASPAALPGLLNAISSRAGTAASVLVVGHQPTLGALSGLLLKKNFPHLGTGSFVYIKFGEGLDSGRAELSEFYDPETI